EDVQGARKISGYLYLQSIPRSSSKTELTLLLQEMQAINLSNTTGNLALLSLSELISANYLKCLTMVVFCYSYYLILVKNNRLFQPCSNHFSNHLMTM
ncbi:hypothetical protein PMAYCL1PPCAC_01301, partial [Pristionchus mayeri]